MDVNATLTLLRELVVDQRHADSDAQAAAFGWQAAELFSNLDEWLLQGGYLPRDWESSVTTTAALLKKREV